MSNKITTDKLIRLVLANMRVEASIRNGSVSATHRFSAEDRGKILHEGIDGEREVTSAASLISRYPFASWTIDEIESNLI